MACCSEACYLSNVACYVTCCVGLSASGLPTCGALTASTLDAAVIKPASTILLFQCSSFQCHFLHVVFWNWLIFRKIFLTKAWVSCRNIIKRWLLFQSSVFSLLCSSALASSSTVQAVLRLVMMVPADLKLMPFAIASAFCRPPVALVYVSDTVTNTVPSDFPVLGAAVTGASFVHIYHSTIVFAFVPVMKKYFHYIHSSTGFVDVINAGSSSCYLCCCLDFRFSSASWCFFSYRNLLWYPIILHQWYLLNQCLLVICFLWHPYLLRLSQGPLLCAVFIL